MLTIEQLTSSRWPHRENAEWELLPFLEAAMTEFAIRVARSRGCIPGAGRARIRTVPLHGGDLGPTPAQERYEPPSSLATRLGNTESGDGKRFKGRGPIQITGRANYRRYGTLLGIDLLASPARAAVSDTGFRIAGLFWRENGLNELADPATDEAFRTITKRINGGLNGLAERRSFDDTAREALGVGAVPVSRSARAVRGRRALEGPVLERGAEAIRRARRPAKRMRKGR